MNKLVIDSGDANLVVEKYGELEFVIYFQDKKTDCITQDVITVRRITEDNKILNNSIECLVWTDDSDEDYTHKFLIKQFLEIL